MVLAPSNINSSTTLSTGLLFHMKKTRDMFRSAYKSNPNFVRGTASMVPAVIFSFFKRTKILSSLSGIVSMVEIILGVCKKNAGSGLAEDKSVSPKENLFWKTGHIKY